MNLIGNACHAMRQVPGPRRLEIGVTYEPPLVRVSAIERLREKTYDLVLTDVKMPVLDGPGLYAELARDHSPLLGRIVFLTGDVLTPGTRAFLEETRAPVLGKPFGLDDVRRVMRRLLG